MNRFLQSAHDLVMGLFLLLLTDCYVVGEKINITIGFLSAYTSTSSNNVFDVVCITTALEDAQTVGTITNINVR